MSKEVKRELGRRVEAVLQPEYLESTLRPYVQGPQLDGGWDTNVLQLDGTGAATIEIKHDGRKEIFAKLYYDESGAVIYEKLKALRNAGLGTGERYQAVEPLAFIPEYGMMLARAAEGVPVSAHIGGDGSALVEGARESARWLAKLHTSPVRVGKARALVASSEVLSVGRRFAKITARRGDYYQVGVEMIRTLERMAEDVVEGLLVQSHGQYRPIHVFVSDATVTVIDLDRTRPCDPARDLAEFVWRLRRLAFEEGGDASKADAPTDTFLETYASTIGDARYLANLQFHLARYAIHSINKQMKDLTENEEDRVDDPEDQARLEGSLRFCQSEYEKVLQGRFSV
jgi:hypothetical protein